MVEVQRRLSSRKESIRSGAKCGPEAGRLWLGPRALAERTENMKAIFVTLDVSKFSGWLNADGVMDSDGKPNRFGKDCQVERRAHTMRVEARLGTRRADLGRRLRTRCARGGSD